MLSFLLRFWFFPAFGMFFAEGSSAIATAGDGGSGDTSGDAGSTSDEGSSSTDDGGDSGDSAGDRLSAEDSADGDGANDPNALVDTGDGRKIPAKYKELFEKDKDLRNTYFSYQALKKAFPGGVKEAVQLARNVAQLGGLEGIEQLQSDLDSYSSDAEAFNNGDRKWVEASFAENADISLKHFTNALDYVSEHHPEQYDHLMAQVITNDLANLDVHGIYGVLAGLKDNPEAQKYAKALASYYNSRSDLARKAPEKQIDPQQKRLDAERQQLGKEKQQVRNKTINTEAGPYLNRAIESSLGAAAKSAGFDLAKLQKEQPNRWGRFVKDVRAAVHADVLNDKKWLDRYSSALASNDTAKCVRMLNARHDQAIKGTDSKGGVAAGIFHEWFGPPKAGSRQTTTVSTGNGDRRASSGTGKETPTLLNALPPAKDINYADPATDKWNGIYRLKTGKLIQVKRP